MRDDVIRNMSLPRKLKRALSLCNNEADFFNGRALTAFEDAIVRGVANEISSRLMDNVKEWATSNTRDLFDSSLEKTPHQLGGFGSGKEGQFLTEVKFLHGKGLRGEELVKSAMQGVVEDQIKSSERQMIGAMHKENVSYRDACYNRVPNISRSANVSEMAACILKKDFRHYQKMNSRKVTADDNLLG